MATIILEPGRKVPADVPWWLLVAHQCPYCDCRYLLDGEALVTLHEQIVYRTVDQRGFVHFRAEQYAQSACPNCERFVATREPLGFAPPPPPTNSTVVATAQPETQEG